MLEELLAQINEHKANPSSAIPFAVGVVLELSWKALEDSARQFGCLLGMFAAAPIPKSLLLQVAQSTLSEEFDEDSLDATCQTFIQLNLIQCINKNSYLLHENILKFFRVKLSQLLEADSLKQGFCNGMGKVAKQILYPPLLEETAFVASIIPHVVKAATDWADWSSDEDMFWLCLSLGRFYADQKLYGTAEPCYERYLVVAQSHEDKEDLSIDTAFDYLTEYYHLLSQQGGSARFAAQARDLMPQPDDKQPSIIQSLDRLALLCNSQGRYREAEPMLVLLLELKRSLLGEEDPDVATSFNRLAELYVLQGRYSEAEPLYLHVLELRKRLLGEEHPDFATSLNNLGQLYRSLDRLDEAERLYLQALELRKQLLGENHPDVATSLNNLAYLYNLQSRLDEAERLYLQALGLRKRLLGEAHPDIATSLDNLGAFYVSQGRYSEAEPLHVQALELRKRLLGEAHPDVALSLNNLAYLYFLQGQYGEAKPLFQQALEIVESRLGNHPWTETLRKNYSAFQKQLENSNS